MPTVGLVKAGTYRDSVALMVLTGSLGDVPGVQQASAMMATPANLEILRATDLFVSALSDAGPNDLCVVVRASDEGIARGALAHAEALLAGGGRPGRPDRTGDAAWRPRTLQAAARDRPEANVALVSVPGEHAAHEARLALLAGLNVFLFSDNVPLAEEVALKTLAAERGLLVMGPDCGTALIGGAPLGFANAVRRGSIGVVGSSGTGIQEVTCLIDRLGAGVSHALGTGGRDLHADVGGRSFLVAVDALASDPGTDVVVAIGKPGDPAVEARVVERLASCGKPGVVYFLGGGGRVPYDAAGASGLVDAADLEHAARCAVALARGEGPAEPADLGDVDGLARSLVAGLGPMQRAVCGLFAGGTLAHEAAAALAGGFGADTHRSLAQDLAVHRPVAPNVADQAGQVLRLGPHLILDLGDDAYTRGRPHPLIDARLRNAEIVRRAASGETALLLLDVILGTGAHPDPAGALAPTLADARAASERAGGTVRVLASLTGTNRDAQGYARQRAALEAAGVTVARSSSQAAAVAARVASLLAGAN